MIALFIIETFVILFITGFLANMKLRNTSLIERVKSHENLIDNLAIEMDHKDKTIKFLSDQNMILSNIPKIFEEQSEIIRNEKMKVLENKLRELLQTSK